MDAELLALLIWAAKYGIRAYKEASEDLSEEELNQRIEFEMTKFVRYRSQIQEELDKYCDKI